MSGSLDPAASGRTPPRGLPALATPARLPPRPIGSPIAGAPVGTRTRPALEPNATIVDRIDVSASAVRFVVRPDAPCGPFVAGQYLAVGAVIDGRLVQRPYSSASEPAADAHEFLVRLVPGGALTPTLWQAAPGTRVWLGRPKGEFVLDPADDRPHLFIASGTGLAPFVSMSRALARRPSPPRVVLLHGVATSADLAFGAELAALAATGLPMAVEATVSRPSDPASAGWRGRTGRAEGALSAVLADHGLRPGEVVAYLCGNPGMVAAAAAVLAEAGFPATDVRAERYWVDTGVGVGASVGVGAGTGVGASVGVDAGAGTGVGARAGVAAGAAA